MSTKKAKRTRTAPPADAEPQIDIDGDDIHDTAPAESDPSVVDPIASNDDATLTREGTDVADDGRPAYPDFMEGAKTKTTGGDGTGGREWVCCETNGAIVVRPPRGGDEDRPQCPNCSTDEVAVLLGAKSSPTIGATATTYYACPVPFCSHSTSRLRAQIAQNLINRHRNGGKSNLPKPHISRPS